MTKQISIKGKHFYNDEGYLNNFERNLELSKELIDQFNKNNLYYDRNIFTYGQMLIYYFEVSKALETDFYKPSTENYNLSDDLKDIIYRIFIDYINKGYIPQEFSLALQHYCLVAEFELYGLGNFRYKESQDEQTNQHDSSDSNE